MIMKHFEEDKLYLNNNFLLDDFSLECENTEGLKGALETMSEETHCEMIFPQELKIYSILGKDDEFIKVAVIDPDHADNRMVLKPDYFRSGNIGRIRISDLKEAGITKALLKEMLKVGFYMIWQRPDGEEVTLLASKFFMATFCRQLGIKKLNDGPDLIRDIYLASRMRSAEPFNIVYRTSPSGIGKLFGAFSLKFGKIPQMVVYEFLEKIPADIAIRHWEVNHFVTTVEFAIPQMAVRFKRGKVTPGIRFSLSDVGDSSYCLQNVLYLNGSYVMLKEKSARRHTGELNVDELVAEYEEFSFPELKGVMEKLDAFKAKEVKNVREETKQILSDTGILDAFSFKYIEDFLEMAPDTEGTKQDAVIEALKIPGIIKNVCTSRNMILKSSATMGRVLEWEEEQVIMGGTMPS